MWREHKEHILSQDEVERRASGRRHFNRLRQFRALERQGQVMQLLAQGIRTQQAIARQLGVHPSTISRDMQALQALSLRRCPTCGRISVPAGA
jgi:predicted DNA-binding transcriptional regulator YafY